MPSPPSSPEAPAPDTPAAEGPIPEAGGEGPLIPAGAPQPGLNLDQAMRQAHAHWTAGHVDRAEQLCQQILRAWPGYADALHLLGVMAVTWGNLDAAIGYLRQACKAPRAPALYHSNLAEMLRRKGLRAEALSSARQAVALEPGLAHAWNNLGIILQEEGGLAESALALERAINLNHDFVEAYANLGNTRKAQGRLQHAHDLYRQALALRPDYAEAACNLSAVLTALGDRDGALAQAQRAIDLRPQMTDAYLNAATAEISRGRFEAALSWLNGLLSFSPDLTAGLALQARVLTALDRCDEALMAVERALILKPHDPVVLAARAAVLSGLGRFEEALADYDSAIERGGAVSMLEGKATLLLQLGRIAEADTVFDRILGADPALPLVWHRRVETKTFSADDPDITAMERLLTSTAGQGFDESLALHFALGKAYLDAADGPAAFRHLHAGNRLKRSAISYDPDGAERWLTSIAAHYGPEVIAHLGGKGDPSDAPVFIIGPPRSGGALIEQILAAHPAVYGGGELSVVQQLSRRVRNAQRQPQAYPGYTSALGAGQVIALGRQYIGNVRLRAGRLGRGEARRLVDATPLNVLYAGLIHLMLPHARFLHIHRDPVDTGFSIYSRLFASEQPFAYDLSEIGRFLRASDRLVAHWQSVLPADRWLAVGYEQIVADPEAASRRMIEFCGLPWDDACLTFWETKRLVQTPSLCQVRQPIYASGVGRWKPHADALQPLLTALGRPLDEAAKWSRPA